MATKHTTTQKNLTPSWSHYLTYSKREAGGAQLNLGQEKNQKKKHIIKTHFFSVLHHLLMWLIKVVAGCCAYCDLTPCKLELPR